MKADRLATFKRVARVTGLYVMAAAGVWQAADVAFDALGLPPQALTLVVVGAIALLPLVAVVAWATSPSSISRLSTARRGAIMAAAGAFAAIAAIVVVAVVSRTDPPAPELPADVALATIRETVFAGDIASGAAMADRLAERSDVSRELKLEAYRHVARAAVRSGDAAAARSALDRMLDLEPPAVILQPAVEPAELIALYSAARRDRVSSVAAGIVLDSAVFSVGPMAVTGLDLETLAAIGADPDGVEAVRTALVQMAISELAKGLRVVDRGGLVEVESDDLEAYYRYYDDVRAGRVPELVVETHAITGSLGVSGNRVLVSLWAMDLRSGAVVGHGLAEGDWPSGFYDTIIAASNAIRADVTSRAQ